MIWLSASFLVIALFIIGYIKASDMFKGADEGESLNNAAATKTEADLEHTRLEIQGNISEEELGQYHKDGLNPFGDSTHMSELTSYHYNEYIHGMSHQKVKASEKWGFYEIHPTRINWLLEGLETVDVDNEEIYQDILERWRAKDFSRVDKDHNQIWKIQNGTIGEASGILSPEEEQAYINSKR
ncbi:DUF6241 domain-containing protein [Oceanobacillus piezotolerans]|uniref:DUF6241 domain-containing protein n=1 Tax=Oceanobacillus piezotolerans TaxID=2448030 RepID=UPI001FE73AA8|nr:DUF6241 domain-containing protein [Oceanobacillus piezotolerans]